MMFEEEPCYKFESDDFSFVQDATEDLELFPELSSESHMVNLLFPQERDQIEFQCELDPVREKGMTEESCQFPPTQPQSPLLDFNHRDEDQSSQSSADYLQLETQSQIDPFEGLNSPSDPRQSDLVAEAVQSKSVSEASWHLLGPWAQAVVIAWLHIEIKGDLKDEAQKQELYSELKKRAETTGLLRFVNELLAKRSQKRPDLYKRTFYKSFIQHLVGKYTTYKHTKSYKIKDYTSFVAAMFFNSSDEKQDLNLRSIFENTKHFSVPSFKQLSKASAQFRGEFDQYMSVVLQQEIQKEIKEFCKRLFPQQSTEQPDVIRFALSVVEKRTLVPWTSFDVEAAQEIYLQMTQKADK